MGGLYISFEIYSKLVFIEKPVPGIRILTGIAYEYLLKSTLWMFSIILFFGAHYVYIPSLIAD